MNWKPILLSLVLLCSVFMGSAASQNYTHNEKLYMGNQIDINDYIIEYKTSRSGKQMLRIGEWTGTSFRIIKEIKGMNIYDAEGQQVKVSENISLTINRTGYDRDGRFIDLSISGSKDILSSGKMTTTAPDRIIISRGDSADVPLSLKNTGFLNQTYQLRAETNSSLKTSFSYQDFNVTEVYVPAGEKEDITAKIQVPEEATVGNHKVRLVAENYTTFSKTIHVEVKGVEKNRELEMEVEQIYKEVRPGKKAEFYVTVTSRGEAKLQDINITANPPDDWEYSMDDGFIEELEGRYDRARAKVTVTAPQDVKAGDYIMKLSAESKRTGIDQPKEVRIHVRKKSGLAYIGAVLMVASLLILAVVYRKFQRR